jgi:hypothetical protein
MFDSPIIVDYERRTGQVGRKNSIRQMVLLTWGCNVQWNGPVGCWMDCHFCWMVGKWVFVTIQIHPNEDVPKSVLWRNVLMPLKDCKVSSQGFVMPKLSMTIVPNSRRNMCKAVNKLSSWWCTIHSQLFSNHANCPMSHTMSHETWDHQDRSDPNDWPNRSPCSKLEWWVTLKYSERSIHP